MLWFIIHPGCVITQYIITHSLFSDELHTHTPHHLGPLCHLELRTLLLSHSQSSLDSFLFLTKHALQKWGRPKQHCLPKVGRRGGGGMVKEKSKEERKKRSEGGRKKEKRECEYNRAKV